MILSSPSSCLCTISQWWEGTLSFLTLFIYSHKLYLLNSVVQKLDLKTKIWLQVVIWKAICRSTNVRMGTQRGLCAERTGCFPQEPLERCRASLEMSYLRDEEVEVLNPQLPSVISWRLLERPTPLHLNPVLCTGWVCPILETCKAEGVTEDVGS